MIDIKIIKENIENNKLNDNFLVFKYSDNTWLVNQYINTIAEYKGLELTYVNSIEEMLDNKEDIFSSCEDELLIFKEETVKFIDIDYSKLTNCIVVCKTIKDNSTKLIDGYLIDFPKLKDWNIKYYVEDSLKGVNKTVVDWLCSITNNDIYRLENEVNKIKIFEKDRQQITFKEINNDGGYNDLCNQTIFDLTNAIIKRDIMTVSSLFERIGSMDVEPVGLVTILKNNVKNIINIQLSNNATPESTHLSSGQFYAIKKNNCGYYSQNQLLKLYEFLSDFDYELKSGLLPNDNLLDYITVKVLSV